MTLDITIIIVVATCMISFNAFNKEDLKYRLAFSPYEVKHHQKYTKYITHMFVHADITHLLFNMLSFYFLGKELLQATAIPEIGLNDGLIASYGSAIGSAHFIVLYFLGGIFATVWPMLRNYDNPAYVSLGASGAVSAVIFATILWNPKLELSLMFLPIPIPAYIFGPLYLAFEFWAFRRNKTNIAHDAHIGGALFGVIYVLIINFDKGKELIQIIFHR